MKVLSRVPAPWNKGEFANLVSDDARHWLEINWYAEDSPVAGPFREGEELDHLGFEVDDFEGALQRLRDAGYPPVIGPLKVDNWDIAFVKSIDSIWLDVYRINPKARSKSKTRPKKR
jgi:hypothetical protein